MSTFLYVMGWNEILARIFDGFDTQRNVAPDWLINPSTRRKLKLDLYYPEIGIALRMVGLQAKGQGRKSDWEELEESARDEVRKELCRQNGVDLILLSPANAYPSEQFKEIGAVIGSAARRIAKKGAARNKGVLMEKLATSRKQLDAIRRKVSNADDLIPFAELWRDREATVEAQAPEPLPMPKPPARKAILSKFKEGAEVQHAHFGPGKITSVDPRDGDVYLTVSFVTAGERRFAASLVADKLAVVRAAA